MYARTRRIGRRSSLARLAPVARVAAIIFHPPAAPGAGPLSTILAEVRGAQRGASPRGLRGPRRGRRDRRRAGVRRVVRRDGPRRVRRRPGDGVVVLGSGSLPLARQADRAAFVAAAAGPSGTALANNRYSADAIAVAGTGPLEELPDLASDNGLPRLLERAGVDRPTTSAIAGGSRSTWTRRWTPC